MSIGYVVGLDYKNPYLNPYQTFQQWKTHPRIASVLEGGECIAYGARALNEGGFQCIPKVHWETEVDALISIRIIMVSCVISYRLFSLCFTHVPLPHTHPPRSLSSQLTFPGGALVGCAAGFLNVPKIKGSHNAMKTGLMAGEEAVTQVLQRRKAGASLASVPVDMAPYEARVKGSEVWSELHRVRNFHPSFSSPLGNIGGYLYSGIAGFVTKGKEPW